MASNYELGGKGFGGESRRGRCSRSMKEETAVSRAGFLERGAEEGGVTVGGDCRPTEPLFQRARRPAKKLMK